MSANPKPVSSALIRRYFESRLKGQRLNGAREVKVRCIFHDDRTPSLSVNFERGVWKCHAGCGDGGILDFEEKYSRCDREQARANVDDLIGQQVFRSAGEKPEAVYQYHDAAGRLLFEKLRYPGKRFVQRKPAGKGGYEYKLEGVKNPLYRLPEVLTANEILICEGEKDADNVRAAFQKETLSAEIRLACTTNFDGAGKWRDEYAPFFAGKKAVILPDQDAIGRKHAQQVAASVFQYAAGVKIVSLPGLAEKGDVSDYLRAHSAGDLIAEIKKASQWRPAEAIQKLFVPAPHFVAQAPQQIDWLVEGIIERAANGFFSAVPKGGKSWAAIDLAISLALGCDWLGFRVPKAVKVALVSREDNPSLTAWRIQKLFAGKSCPLPELIELNLHVNSRRQSAEMMLDNPEHMGELMVALKTLRPEFAIFDVFNVLHCADENDNQEMRTVLRQLSRIQAEIGCGIAVVHHFNKSDYGSMTQRLRGSSAIAGWAEWLIGFSMADEETKTRRMEFELKAAEPPEPIHYRIESTLGISRLERVPYRPACATREGSAAERLMSRGVAAD